MLPSTVFLGPYPEHAATRWLVWPRLPWLIWGLILFCLLAGLWLQWAVDSRAWMIQLHAHPVLPEALWAGLTLLGFGWAVLILMHALDRQDGRFALAACLSVVFGGVLINTLKWLWPHARPALMLGESQLTVIGIAVKQTGSMPSGHAAAASALVTLAVLCLLARGGLSTFRLVGLLVLGALVAWSRVAVGAHWPADVMVGTALGIVIAVVALHLAGRWWNTAQGWTQARARQQMWCLCAMELMAAAVCFGTDTGQPSVWWLQGLLGTLGVVSCLLRLRRGLWAGRAR